MSEPAARESLNHGRPTYDRTLVDALLSELAVLAILDALDPADVLGRIKEFGIEVGMLDAEGNPRG